MEIRALLECKSYSKFLSAHAVAFLIIAGCFEQPLSPEQAKPPLIPEKYTNLKVLPSN
jgi:hypothetical protein